MVVFFYVVRKRDGRIFPFMTLCEFVCLIIAPQTQRELVKLGSFAAYIHLSDEIKQNGSYRTLTRGIKWHETEELARSLQSVSLPHNTETS